MSRAGVVAVVAATIAGALVVFVPHLKSRIVSTGTPVPQALAQPASFSVPAHQPMCLDQVAVEPGPQVAYFAVITPTPGPALRFTISGESYAQTHKIPAGYTSGGIVVPFEGPPSSRLTTVCIRNLGARDLQIQGTTETRTLSRPRMTVGGAPTDGEFSLGLQTANGESKFKLVGTIADRISAFKPVWVQPWLVVVLLFLVLVGSFAVPLLALWRSFVLDERQ